MFDREWRPVDDYRGQYANMHLVAAYLASFESDGDPTALDRARSITERLIHREGRAHRWRIPEHFDAQWQVDPDFNRDRPTDPFRPFGTLVGHSFEWARLILNASALGPGMDRAVDAVALFDRDGGSWWHGLDPDNRPAATTWDGKPDLYHAWRATLYARVRGDRGVAAAAAEGLVATPSLWNHAVL